MVREGFKETELGEIPEDWIVTKVQDLAKNITVGFVGSMSFLFRDEGVPLLRGINIQPHSLDLTNLKYIPLNTHRQWRNSALQASDVVIVRVGYPGTACVIPEGLGEINAASLVIIRPNPGSIDSDYLCYVFNSPWGKEQIYNRLVGGAQQVFNTHTASEFSIPLPKIAEQVRIAGVLSILDTATKKTEVLIAKLRQVKAGLMQDLLTKGIDEQGRIRSQVTHAFRDTEIGQVPADWEILPLRFLIKRIQTGQYYQYADFRESGNKCLKIDNVGYNRIIWDTVTYLPDSFSDIYPEMVLNEDDIVMALNRPITHDTLKIAKLKKSDLPALLYQRVGKLHIDSEKSFSEFIIILFNGQHLFNEIRKTLVGSDQPYIKNSDLLEIKIPLPSRHEQHRIVASLTAFNHCIEQEITNRDKLLALKKGLMTDLLTGRVRMPAGVAETAGNGAVGCA